MIRKALLAAGLALAVMGGIGGAAQPASARVFISVGVHPHHHYWWHNRWYDNRPMGYYYVAPPYAYEHPYWRAHHYRWVGPRRCGWRHRWCR